MKDGVPRFTYNDLGLTRSVAGGTATLSVNGTSVGSVKVPKMKFSVFSADETAGVGIDMETTVSESTTALAACLPARSTRLLLT